MEPSILEFEQLMMIFIQQLLLCLFYFVAPGQSNTRCNVSPTKTDYKCTLKMLAQTSSSLVLEMFH